MTLYHITPVPAPRMTRSDKWRTPRRPCVQRYFDFRDAVNACGMEVPIPCILRFYIPMPPSWSQKKKMQMIGRPHTQKLDIDNLQKAVFDSVFKEDGHVWGVQASKYWAERGYIEVEPISLPPHRIVP